MRTRGRPPYPDILTPRQWEVLALLREGLSNEEIARRLGISLDGVKFHVSEILGKLGVSNRNEAARWQRQERATSPMASLRGGGGCGPRSWRAGRRRFDAPGMGPVGPGVIGGRRGARRVARVREWIATGIRPAGPGAIGGRRRAHRVAPVRPAVGQRRGQATDRRLERVA